MNRPLRADDHILLLAIPAHQEVARLARVLVKGSLVALGTADEVDAARQTFSEFDNVLFLNARPDAIPWREHYFTQILVPPHLEPLMRSIAPELDRVLAPGGAILTQRQDA